jgi:hypothetical protein
VNGTLAMPFLVTCGVLVAILPLEWLPAAAPPVVKPAVAIHAASATGDSEPRDTGDWADTVLGRPLFTVGRRPPKSSGGGHLIANTGFPRLAGIMITPSGKWAIFAPDGGKALVLSPGGALEDATVRTIHRDRVVVSGPKGEQVLWPTYDHNPSRLTTTQPIFGQPGFNGGNPVPGFGGPFPGRPAFPMQPPQMPQPPPQGAQGDSDDDTPSPPAPLPNQPNFPGQPVPAFPRE